MFFVGWEKSILSTWAMDNMSKAGDATGLESLLSWSQTTVSKSVWKFWWDPQVEEVTLLSLFHSCLCSFKELQRTMQNNVFSGIFFFFFFAWAFKFYCSCESSYIWVGDNFPYWNLPLGYRVYKFASKFILEFQVDSYLWPIKQRLIEHRSYLNM